MSADGRSSSGRLAMASVVDSLPGAGIGLRVSAAGSLCLWGRVCSLPGHIGLY